MLNKVLLQGRLTADPELRYTPNNTAVATFSLAVERNFKDDNGERKADFIRIVAWRKAGEFVNQYFHKGDMMIVDGSIQTRSYDNQQGNRVYVTEVLLEHAYFAAVKKEQTAQNSGYGQNTGYGALTSVDNEYPFGTPFSFSDSDLPF